ncbi:MAG: saccharopine dehydrogenase family protein [Actinomycetota bacterium]
MPDILVFGATGYTGKLVARELAQRGASIVLAGRDRAKLETLAATTGDPEVRLASVGDVDGLVSALEDCRVLLTCVGPFSELGWTAVEAALRARVNYLDSTGESSFVARLIGDYDEHARDAGIAMAPAMGFDEVPGDVAATLAAERLERPEMILTYALPSSGSLGTVKSALGILTTSGPWIRDGERVMIAPGQRTRWSPMPPPLGPKPAVSFPLANGELIPLHLDLRTLELYVTIGTPQKLGLKFALPIFKSLHALPGARKAIERTVEVLKRAEGPDDKQRRAWWTILAEARSGDRWRNVALTGRDVYGLTARLLAAAAMKMSQPSYDRTGVMAPVQAMDLDWLEKELLDGNCKIASYGPSDSGS